MVGAVSVVRCNEPADLSGMGNGGGVSELERRAVLKSDQKKP